MRVRPPTLFVWVVQEDVRRLEIAVDNLLPAILGISRRLRSRAQKQACFGQVFKPFPQHRFGDFVAIVVEAVLPGELTKVSTRMVADVQAVREGRAVGRIMLQPDTLMVELDICDRLHHRDLHVLRVGRVERVDVPSSGLDPHVMRYLCGLHDYTLHNVAIRAKLEVQAVPVNC